MRLSLRPTQRLAIRCTICNGDGEHTDDCPFTRLEALRKKQKRIQCPTCGASAVDVNAEDYYECRQCHTQYCRAEHPLLPVTGEKKQLIIDEDAPIMEGFRTVHVLVDKGNGKFPSDEAVENLRRQFEEMEKEA